MSDDRLIVALDVPNIIAGIDLVNKLGETVSFYKIGLGMLTGGGLALADELKQEHMGFFNIEIILAFFPNAKFIHTHRNIND